MEVIKLKVAENLKEKQHVWCEGTWKVIPTALETRKHTFL
jgi:hypothetical protein